MLRIGGSGSAAVLEVSSRRAHDDGVGSTREAIRLSEAYHNVSEPAYYSDAWIAQYIMSVCPYDAL